MDCWSKHSEKRPSGYGIIKCNFCTKMGHKESDCWDKYPEKQHDWLKDKTKHDRSGAAVEMIDVLMTTTEGVIVKKKTCLSSILFFSKKTTDWMLTMTVLLSIVSIVVVVGRVTSKSTVGPRRQTKMTRAIWI